MKSITGVTATMIEVHLPKLFPTMSIQDILKVEQWYVQEGEIVQPEGLLLEVDAPPGLITIPAPPTVTTPCRVVRIYRTQGSSILLGDLLIALEPVSQKHTR